MINASLARKTMISDLIIVLRSNEPNKFQDFVTVFENFMLFGWHITIRFV